jgi:hypothetical protein
VPPNYEQYLITVLLSFTYCGFSLVTVIQGHGLLNIAEPRATEQTKGRKVKSGIALTILKFLKINFTLQTDMI